MAHPHVWVVVKAELLYEPGGQVTGVRHHWTFDEAYSTMRCRVSIRTETAVLARRTGGTCQGQRRVPSNSSYFTSLKADGKRQDLATPAEPWPEHSAGQLTLHFTLPVKEPSVAKRTLILDVADPTFFVDFSYAEDDSAITPSRALRRTASPK